MVYGGLVHFQADILWPRNLSDLFLSYPGQQTKSGLIHLEQRQDISLPGKAWLGIGLAVLTLTTWHSVTLMQDIPAVVSACWGWLYITVLGLLFCPLNTDQSAKNNRGFEKDKWLKMDKSSIDFIHTGPWLLYHTVTVRGMLDWLYCIPCHSGKKICGQQSAKVRFVMESYRIYKFITSQWQLEAVVFDNMFMENEHA